MHEYEIRIIEAILHQGILHYPDIEKITGKSNKTVAKYLDQVQDSVTKYGAQLVRKRNVGVFLEGDIKQLEEAISNHFDGQLTKSGQQKQISLLSRLLLSSQPLTIQELAEAQYVSRSTLESDLKDLKRLLAHQGARLQSNHKGIFIVANERIRRRLMAELLSMYWGQPNYIGPQQTLARSTIKVPAEIRQLFSVKTLDKVIASLDEFQDISSLLLNDYEYQSLAIHLVIAIERIRRNEMLKDSPETLRLESSTQLLVSIIERSFQMTIPEDERQYINIHILAAQRDDKSDEDGFTLTDGDISRFLCESLQHYDETLVRNLTLHLVPALKRLSLGLKLRNPYTAEIKQNFPLAYNRAVDLGIKIQDAFNVDMSEDELAFISLHMEAYIERGQDRITAVLVCSTGLGTARLLEQRIKKYFPEEIDVKRVVSVQELKQTAIHEDIVISTVNFKTDNHSVIVVPPFLDKKSAQKIETQANIIRNRKPKPNDFIALVHPELVLLVDTPLTRDQAIRRLGRKIEHLGFGKRGISEAAVQREKMASTAINMVAIPHAPIDFVEQPCIGILVDPAGITWDGQNVKIVFFLAMNQKMKTKINYVYSYFNDVLEDQQRLMRVERASTPEEVISILGGE